MIVRTSTSADALFRDQSPMFALGSLAGARGHLLTVRGCLSKARGELILVRHLRLRPMNPWAARLGMVRDYPTGRRNALVRVKRCRAALRAVMAEIAEREMT